MKTTMVTRIDFSVATSGTVADDDELGSGLFCFDPAIGLQSIRVLGVEKETVLFVFGFDNKFEVGGVGMDDCDGDLPLLPLK
jgi:hypothetical protein